MASVVTGTIGEPKVKYFLSDKEKLSIISSILSGIGNSARFDVDVIRERIKQSLEIAEEFLCPN